MDDVAICNLALARAQQVSRIEALTENSAEGRACRSVYEATRDRLLSAYPWPWTRRSQTLALLRETPNDRWDFAYALPSDCVTPQEIENGLRASRPDQTIEYEVVQGEAGLELHTDEADAVLWYIAESDDPGRWSPTFRSALAWAVAAELALVLTKDVKLAGALGDMAQREMSQAAAIVANTAKEIHPPTSRLKASRT